MIRIVTDSTCDLPVDWLTRYQITVVPVNIQFGLETYAEAVDLSPADFYQRINQTGLLPTTSQPSAGLFLETYQRLAADGSEILSIHLTSKLSGTWQSAMLAAQQLKEQINVTVIDSLTGSVGLGLMVREAATLAAQGLPLEAVASRLLARRSQINVFILLKELRYARLSGRVGRVRESLATLLKVKPIIGVSQGELIVLERVRGQKRGLERILALVEQAVGQAPVHVAAAHAIDPVQAEELLTAVKSRLNCRDTFMADLALSLAVHFGPGTVGIATYPVD